MQFSMSIDLVYAQLNVKTVLYKEIGLVKYSSNVKKSSISNNSV